MWWKKKNAPEHPCRACGQQAALRRLGDVSPTHPGPFHTNEFGLVCCPRCEVVYLDPAPTSEDLRTLYEVSVQFADDHYTSPDQVARILEYYTHAVRNLGLLDGRGSRVLEIGAGYSWVSRACKSIDPTTRTIAQDVSAECANRCEWVDSYHVGTVEDLAEAEPFKLASMTHVIEHLVDPRQMLATVAQLLERGGKLFVTAPHRPVKWKPSDGIERWRDYSYLHVPAHVTYFSRRWFEQVAPELGLRVAHWDARHEDGQAFELVLERR